MSRVEYSKGKRMPYAELISLRPGDLFCYETIRSARPTELHIRYVYRLEVGLLLHSSVPTHAGTESLKLDLEHRRQARQSYYHVESVCVPTFDGAQAVLRTVENAILEEGWGSSAYDPERDSIILTSLAGYAVMTVTDGPVVSKYKILVTKLGAEERR